MKKTKKVQEDAPLHSNFLLNLLLESFEITTALQTKIDTLQNIIELMPGNVYWKNIDGTILGCNNNMAKVSGLQRPADLIGKNVSDLFDKHLVESVQRHDQKVIDLGKEYSHEELGVNLNNESAVYISKKIPLFHASGKIIGTLGISLDITERKKIEEELKIAKEKAEISNRLKSQFVTAVNHELRTPLVSIIGLVDLLKDETLRSQESNKIIHSIENSAQYLLNLVNDVLDFSKFEGGKQHLQITLVNLSILISDLYELLRPLAKNKNLNLSILIDDNLPSYILSDERILRHLLINFVNNAIKFTEKGQVTLQVQTLHKTSKTIQLKFAISDTGMGIPDDKLELIFKPFQQLNNTNTRSSSRNGTGLGLTIVKKLAETINATIDVKSELGVGSVFSFTADFMLPDEKNIGISPELSSRMQSKDITKFRVLVVEDDAIIQYIHKKLLTNLGCEVDVVSNATQALQVLGNNHDIIFLDMSLPDLTGYDLIKTIRQTTPFNCPIVIISAFLNKEEELACLEAGANAFVSKPISQAKFKELLVYHCSILAST